MNPAHVGRRRRIIVLVMLIAGVTALVLSMQTPSTPAASDRPARLATPLWSARRTPVPIVDLIATGRLQADLNARMEGNDACYMVAGQEGLLGAAAPDTPLIPASTLKVLTAAAALDALGPDFRYETRAVANAKPADGTIARLWLIGSGDPVITTPEAAVRLQDDPETRGDATTPLATLADEIVQTGVRTITEGITGVDSRYDTTRFLSQWPQSYRSGREIGPVGALTVNDGFGGPDGTGGEAEPAINAADQLGRLLTDRGVAVGQPRRDDDVPRDPPPIATLRSPPLRDILTAFLASSDNLTGEMLVRELAAQADRPATTANGTEVVTQRLAGLGLPTAGFTMVDGSGLARGNQVPCRLLFAALGLASDPKFATLRDGMAVAGESGTLAERLRNSALRGKLRAKTGSLSGVTGLAGFSDVKRPVTFSLLLNGDFGESTGTNLREQMAEAIGRYPDVGAPDAVVPAPAPPGQPAPSAQP